MGVDLEGFVRCILVDLYSPQDLDVEQFQKAATVMSWHRHHTCPQLPTAITLSYPIVNISSVTGNP
jgi:hypothetical protein